MSFDIVTYCSRSYWSRLEKTLNSWSSQKSVDNIYIHTDHEVDNKISNKIIYKNMREEESTCFGQNCALKAESLQYFINNYKFNNAILLDIDCMVMKDLNDLFDEDFNIFVTVYPEIKPRYQTNNISAGFVAIKNCNPSKDFINKWIDRQNNLGQAPCRDQKALSETITDLYKYSKDIYKIKLLNGNVWNSHPFSGGEGYIREWLHRIRINKPYILHFASGAIDKQEIIDNAIIATEK